MNSGPHHLAKFNTTPDPNFHMEVVYRRCPFGNRTSPFKVEEMFLDISWKDLTDGLSVNRSKYAKPEDALWSFVHEDPLLKKCEYSEKNGIVYSSETEHYPTTDLKTGAKFSLIHTPIPCNISHCDIKMENVPTELTKAKKRDIKAFLATFFHDP